LPIDARKFRHHVSTGVGVGCSEVRWTLILS